MLYHRLKEIYFKDQHAVVLPEDRGENNLDLATTVSANFASMGMALNKEMTEKLSRASKDDIIGFYREYTPLIKDMIGDFGDAKQFYQNFPEDVLSKSDVELWFDQIVSYITLGTFAPSDLQEAQERFPFIGKVQQHPLVEGSEKDFLKIMQVTMRSAVSFTPRQIENIKAFFGEYPGAERFAPARESLKQKENLIILGILQKDALGSKTLLERYLQDPTDVLRYAAVRSAIRDEEKKGQNPSQDELVRIYQKASLMYDKSSRPSFTLTKKDRRFVATALEKISKGDPDRLAVDMYRHRQDWKRLIKNVHITDYPNCKTVATAFDKVSKNVSIDRHDKTVEEAIKKGDLKTALFEAANHPGDLMNRADKFLRMAKNTAEQEMVIGAIRGCVQRAGIAKTVAVLSTMSTRDTEEESRSFVIAKSNKTFETKEKNRKPLDRRIIDELHEACIDGLGEKFKGKEPMGKVYMSPEMENYTVPSATRKTSDSVETYPTGSRVAIDTQKGEVLRLFAHWTNMEGQKDDCYAGRVDNDLTGTMYREDGTLYASCGWDGSRRGHGNNNRAMFVYSGDMTNGGPIDGKGVAEYIDFDLKALKEAGVRYIVTGLTCYTGNTFAAQPHTSFGTMMRSYEDMGKEFEPQAVTTKMRLVNESTSICPAIIDTYEDRMIWVDKELRGTVMSRSNDIKPLLDYVTKHNPMKLSEMIECNVKHNGEFVKEAADADILFITPAEEKELRENEVDLEGKTIIYPYNLPYITGVLMAEPEPEQARVRENERKADELGKDLEDLSDRLDDLAKESMSQEDYEEMCRLEGMEQAEAEEASAIDEYYEENSGDYDDDYDVR